MHKWTFEEDLFCCMRYIDNYIIHHCPVEASYFVYELGVELKEISESGLRRKVRQIKQLSLDEEIFDNLCIFPLKGYSRQCKNAFYIAMVKCQLEEYRKEQQS